MALFALLTLLPVAILSYTAIALSSDTITHGVRAEAQALATLEAHTIADRMDSVRELVASGAANRTMIVALGNGHPGARNLPALRDVLQQTWKGDPGLAYASVYDLSGRLIALAPLSPSIIGESYSYRDWYKGVIRTGRPYTSSAFQSAAPGHPLVIGVAAPIRAMPAAGRISPIIGYLQAGYYLTAVQQFVSGFERGQAVSLTVTDQRGVIVAAPGQRPGLVSETRDPRVRSALAGQSGIVSVGVNGARVLSAYAPVRDIGWTVHADILESTAFASANRLRLAVEGVAGMLGLVLLLTAFVLGRAWRGRAAAQATVRALNAELETRVARRTADLERSNQNLEAFTYSVAHDLRTPLRAMSGFSDALVEEYGDRLDETGRGYAARVAAATERMGNLIDDLLLLSRVTRATMHLEQVNLSAEVTDISKDLQRREPDRHARFVIQDGVWAMADRGLIRTVLENLLGNAWKFTSGRPQTCIEFGTAPADAGPICCFVRDNGAGFDPAYASKLFQPFQRLHDAAEFPGTGIGLASVRRIVERHGGHTRAQGAVDEGATFYFTIDTRPADGQPSAPADTRTGAAPPISATRHLPPSPERGTLPEQEPGDICP